MLLTRRFQSFSFSKDRPLVGRSRKITHYFAFVITAHAMMCAIAIAQSTSLSEPFANEPGLPTVNESLDYYQSQFPVMPSDLPTVPEAGALQGLVQVAPEVPHLPNSIVDTPPQLNSSPQLAALTQPWWNDPKPISGELGVHQNIELDNLIWYLAAGMLTGARLFYVLVYGRAEYAAEHKTARRP